MKNIMNEAIIIDIIITKWFNHWKPKKYLLKSKEKEKNKYEDVEIEY